jgi:tetratricopeptide (TPR) repeat protein
VWGFYGGIPTWEAYARARAAAEKAKELTPDTPEVHRSLGVIEHYYGWDVAREERELRLAVEGNPRDADAHFWLTLCLCLCSGKEEDALAAARQSVALEPTPATRSRRSAGCPPRAGASRTRCRTSRRPSRSRRPPVFPLWSLGYAQHQVGRFEDAVQTLARVSR